MAHSLCERFEVGAGSKFQPLDRNLHFLIKATLGGCHELQGGGGLRVQKIGWESPRSFWPGTPCGGMRLAPLRLDENSPVGGW